MLFGGLSILGLLLRLLLPCGRRSLSFIGWRLLLCGHEAVLDSSWDVRTVLRRFGLFIHGLKDLLDIGASHSSIPVSTYGECYLATILVIGICLSLVSFSFLIRRVAAAYHTHGALIVLRNFVELDSISLCVTDGNVRSSQSLGETFVDVRVVARVLLHHQSAVILPWFVVTAHLNLASIVEVLLLRT